MSSFYLKKKIVRHKLIIFFIYPLPFLSLVLVDNENIIFLSHELFVYFFYEYRKKNIMY